MKTKFALRYSFVVWSFNGNDWSCSLWRKLVCCSWVSNHFGLSSL